MSNTFKLSLNPCLEVGLFGEEYFCIVYFRLDKDIQLIF